MTAVALVACSAAGADPGAAQGRGIAARPAEWKQLSSIAGAVGDAARADGVVIDAVDAWGEPAAGCYAVRLALHGGTADAGRLADQVVASFDAAGPPGAAAPRGFSIRELVKPTSAQGVVAFAFASPPYRGRLRAQLGSGRITALACFGNQREPLACDAACARILEAGP